jgi:tRNA threonylcarbamoyladenosine biosynthesis protein TsaB
MRVLAIDTSTLAGGVALVDGERTVAEYVLDIRLTHSERLMPAIDRVMCDAGWTPRDLSGLAVAVGPGSFTGLRIGVSAVKGLALALALPIAAVPTLDALARGCRRPAGVSMVLPAATGHARSLPLGQPRHAPGWDYLALSRASWWNGCGARDGSGEDVAAIASPFSPARPPWRCVPSPATVGHLGRERLRRGDVVSAADLVPLYVRPSQAELRRGVVALA